jgi:MFS family permease
MFGYKLFSVYFPLFLVVRGMSLPEVGYTYLLIYLPIALFSPIVGFLNHKINPAVLATIGILGYGVYVLGMILIRDPQLFYFWQVLLGISAALFFVSARAILMSFPLESYNRAFGWFYTAPFYADAIAPVIGALFIWKFNFIGVFIFSLVVQIFTAIFCFTQLKRHCQRTPYQNPKGEQVSCGAGKFGAGLVQYQVKLWCRIFQKMKGRDILPSILISFSVLLLAGFYRTLFVLFLKDSLIWSQNLILIFVSVLSFLFLPASFLIIKYLGRLRSEKNIFQGGLITGISSILFGTLVPVLNFFSILLINFGRLAGSLITNSGRSGLISQKLKENPKEAGAVDTIFAPLGIALGALISGAIVGAVGYSLLFILGGIFVVTVSLIVKKFAKL